MRRYALPLIGASLIIVAVCLLCALSCSWRIFSEGQIQKEIDEHELRTEHPELSIVRILEVLHGTDSTPDSIRFSVTSRILVDSTLYDFVEMEVGELLESQGFDPDTILTDHIPPTD